MSSIYSHESFRDFIEKSATDSLRDTDSKDRSPLLHLFSKRKFSKPLST